MFLKILQNNILKISPRLLSIRARLTTLFVLIFGSTSIIFSIFVYYFLNQSLLKDFDVALYNYAVDVSQSIEIGQNNSLSFPPLKIDENKIFPFQSGNTLFIIRHVSGEILSYGSNSKKFNPEYKKYFEQILAGADSAYATVNDLNLADTEDSSYRIISFPIDNEKNPTLFLQIAAPLSTFETQLDQLKIILQFGLPAIIFVAILSGLYFSSHALRPVQDMIENTKNINASKLSERIHLPASDDEIHELARTINLMLERIENAFLSQEKFIANASHQLLTPITILKGEVELELKNEKDLNRQKFYTSQLQEIDALTGIVRSMLLLAKFDSGKNILNLVNSNPSEIIIDILPQLQKIAERKNIKIKLDIVENSDCTFFQLDTELVSQMFFNIIENAIKYSPPDQIVLIRAIWNTHSTKIEIEDFGQGISEESKYDIFNHFSRADTSSKVKGYGLGLAIAKKIAELHHIVIQLETKKTAGALFSIQFDV